MTSSPSGSKRERTNAVPKKRKKAKIKLDAIELDPDAWPKFEKLIRAMSKKGKAAP